ncbi:MAG: hypothetical protein K2M97_04370 [Muribaculaceae bacterium]|nr:hypothetical protein [Muribaculaceae bacterium]
MITPQSDTYDDIISLSRPPHIPEVTPMMTMQTRAAQFASQSFGGRDTSHFGG